MSTKELPKYVYLGKEEPGNTLRLQRPGGSDLNIEDTYWRDGGLWGVDCKWKDGKLFSVSDMEWINDKELIPTTKEIYMEDNKGYIGSLDTDSQEDSEPDF